jgi:peptidoglycan hydrolase CwlO-like protein
MLKKKMQEERVAFQNELSELKETCKSLQSQIDDLKKLL